MLGLKPLWHKRTILQVSIMDPVKKSHLDLISEIDNRVNSASSSRGAKDPLTGVLRSLGSSLDDRSLAGPPPTSSQDWSALIERVRGAAVHAREVEKQAQEQDLRVQELLERVREDIHAAGERVRAAEARATGIAVRAEERVRDAERRAEIAEERARVAEEWLRRLHETVTAEFSDTQSDRA